MVAIPIPTKPQVTKLRPMTPEEYLEWEAQQESRYEYVEGEIIAMAGESRGHNTIALNISRKIGDAVEEKPCSVYMEGIRIRVAKKKFRYPDVIAVCGEQQIENTRPETLLNPQVLIEVLSDSTRDIDLVDKVKEYLALDSVTDYVIFEQYEMKAYHYRPAFPLQTYANPEDTIPLETIGVTLKLADVYRKITFPAPEAKTESNEEVHDTESP